MTGPSCDVRDQQQQPPTLTRMKTQICYDFTKGNCFRGEDCRYSHCISHIEKVNQTRNKGVCFEHLRGACHRGRLCKFSHDLSSISAAPYPKMNGREKGICFDFIKGACCRGEDCPYSHSLAMISQLGPCHRRPPAAPLAWTEQSQLTTHASELHQQQQDIAYSIAEHLRPMSNPFPPPLLSVTSSGESHMTISPTFSLDQSVPPLIRAIWDKF